MITEEDLFEVTAFFGSVEPKVEYREEDGMVVAYSYSIRRDKNGTEVSRTEPTALSGIGYCNGKPFTLKDLEKLNERKAIY